MARGRNMLMDRNPMPAQPMMQPDGRGRPADEVMQAAREMGYQGDNLEEAMDMLWDAAPTDGVGEMIDAAGRETGARPPWTRQPGGMQQMQPRGSGY